MTHQDLFDIQNENGGGLSNAVTGKYTSVRHELARLDGKLTAGEAAKKISKALKIKVTAKEVQAFCTEWHHSGFYKASGGKKKIMGRTWFIEAEEVNELIVTWNEKSDAMKKEREEKEKKGREIVRGWYVRFNREAVNRFGELGYRTYLGVYEGERKGIPNHFTELSEAGYNNALKQEGRRLEAYEKPVF